MNTALVWPLVLGFWLLCCTINLSWCWWRRWPHWQAICLEWCWRDTRFCIALGLLLWLFLRC